MNLIIDIGNSSIKLAIYDGPEVQIISRSVKVNARAISGKIREYEITKAIISSVREIPLSLRTLLEKEMEYYHVLSFRSKFPFRIDYKTPRSLGTDRIAAIAGVWLYYGGSDTLVIDAGTAITFDLLADRKYCGGSISPGIEMRFRALNKFTGRLPLVSRSDVMSLTATSTTEAINAGVISGVVFEINEYIRTFVTKYPGIKVIITGGDADFLCDKITEGSILKPDVVTDGLNYLLEYNAK